MKIIDELTDYLNELTKTIDDQQYVINELHDELNAVADENERLQDEVAKLKESITPKAGRKFSDLAMKVKNLEIGCSIFEPGQGIARRFCNLAYKEKPKVFASRTCEIDGVRGGAIIRIA
jgi:predicted nuclease with TOPRIM domain